MVDERIAEVVSVRLIDDASNALHMLQMVSDLLCGHEETQLTRDGIDGMVSVLQMSIDSIWHLLDALDGSTTE